jgi:hypothetical protein
VDNNEIIITGTGKYNKKYLKLIRKGAIGNCKPI